jgi:type VI secretion system protein ImpA
MPLPEGLLAPISGDEPAGPDLSISNEYAEVDRAYRDADIPPALSPSGALEAPDTSFADVVELATGFLGSRSKDLKIAVLLTGALIREEGFSGLSSGLELVRGLMDGFWDTLHPGVAGRAAVLNWLGSDAVAYALYLVPLTDSGHTYHHYKEWLKKAQEDGDKGKADSSDDAGANELTAENFEQGFGETPWVWYDELNAALGRSATALEALDALGREKFEAEDERPPRYRDLTNTLKRVTAGAEDLLGRKPPPPPAERAAAAESREAGTAASGAEAASGGAAVERIVVAEPRNPDEAAAAVASAARVLRRAEPHNPAPYLLLRGFRWGELRATGEHPDPRELVAPTTEVRTRLKSLFLDQKWDELLEAAEEVMTTPASRGWLDLQRYAVLAAERLGAEYRHVAAALKGALRALIADLPDLLAATLMDDSSAASRDTVAWLESQGWTEGSEGSVSSAGQVGSADTDAERILREASFERAAGLARAGDPQGAIEMLMDRAEHESSERSRFITRAAAAAIMVQHGMKSVARPMLDELHELINEHKLEEWEHADVVAEPLGLLIRSLDPSDGGLKAQLYDRLAKLDPVLALRVGEDGQPQSTGPAAAPEPAEVARADEPAEEDVDG